MTLIYASKTPFKTWIVVEGFFDGLMIADIRGVAEYL